MAGRAICWRRCEWRGPTVRDYAGWRPRLRGNILRDWCRWCRNVTADISWRCRVIRLRLIAELSLVAAIIAAAAIAAAITATGKNRGGRSERWHVRRGNLKRNCRYTLLRLKAGISRPIHPYMQFLP